MTTPKNPDVRSILKDVVDLLEAGTTNASTGGSPGERLANQMAKNWKSNQKDPTKYDQGKGKALPKPSKYIQGRSAPPTLRPDGSVKPTKQR